MSQQRQVKISNPLKTNAVSLPEISNTDLSTCWWRVRESQNVWVKKHGEKYQFCTTGSNLKMALLYKALLVLLGDCADFKEIGLHLSSQGRITCSVLMRSLEIVKGYE